MSLRQKPAYYCDVCGAEQDKPENLRRVRSESRSSPAGPRRQFKSVGVDVCVPCQSRPISDLLEAIDRVTEAAMAKA